MYKIPHGLVNFSLYQYASPSMITYTQGKAINIRSIPYQPMRTHSISHSYPELFHWLWNNLPPHLIDQLSLNHLRTFLDNIDLYNYCIIVVIPLCIAIPLDGRTVMVNSNKNAKGKHMYYYNND